MRPYLRGPVYLRALPEHGHASTWNALTNDGLYEQLGMGIRRNDPASAWTATQLLLQRGEIRAVVKYIKGILISDLGPCGMYLLHYITERASKLGDAFLQTFVPLVLEACRSPKCQAVLGAELLVYKSKQSKCWISDLPTIEEAMQRVDFQLVISVIHQQELSRYFDELLAQLYRYLLHEDCLLLKKLYVAAETDDERDEVAYLAATCAFRNDLIVRSVAEPAANEDRSRRNLQYTIMPQPERVPPICTKAPQTMKSDIRVTLAQTSPDIEMLRAYGVVWQPVNCQKSVFEVILPGQESPIPPSFVSEESSQPIALSPPRVLEIVEESQEEEEEEDEEETSTSMAVEAFLNTDYTPAPIETVEHMPPPPPMEELVVHSPPSKRQRLEMCDSLHVTCVYAARGQQLTKGVHRFELSDGSIRYGKIMLDWMLHEQVETIKPLFGIKTLPTVIVNLPDYGRTMLWDDDIVMKTMRKGVYHGVPKDQKAQINKLISFFFLFQLAGNWNGLVDSGAVPMVVAHSITTGDYYMMAEEYWTTGDPLQRCVNSLLTSGLVIPCFQIMKDWIESPSLRINTEMAIGKERSGMLWAKADEMFRKYEEWHRPLAK